MTTTLCSLELDRTTPETLACKVRFRDNTQPAPFSFKTAAPSGETIQIPANDSAGWIRLPRLTQETKP
jgi:hypothetical protein